VGAARRRLGFWDIADDEPERVALHQGSRQVRFGELRDEAHRLSNGLRARGLRRGDVIAALLPNDAIYYALHLAAMESGLYYVPVNTHLKAPEIAHIVRNSEARLLIAHDAFADTASAAAQQADLPFEGRLAVGTIDGFGGIEEITRDQPCSAPADRSPGQEMLYTSGTTGLPKGVRRPLPEGDPSRLAHESTVFARAFRLEPFDGVHLVIGPLHHAGPAVFSWGSLNVGHAQVLTDHFDARHTLELIEKYRVTNTHLVATMFHRLLALPKAVRDRYDVSSLRTVAHSATPTPVDVKKRMMEWWGAVIWKTYGGTEGAATIAKPHRWLERPGTAGRAVGGVRLSILDDQGAPCRPGEQGTVYIEGNGPPFEYWKDPAKTDKAWRGRAFTLGDIGYVDEDGYLFLTGRKNDTIITGGVNVYPAEVENVLLSHPGVADVAVIGIPDEEWGERVHAVVQPGKQIRDHRAFERELIDYCREHIAHFKCPRSVALTRRLPREENGKLYKERLRHAHALRSRPA